LAKFSVKAHFSRIKASSILDKSVNCDVLSLNQKIKIIIFSVSLVLLLSQGTVMFGRSLKSRAGQTPTACLHLGELREVQTLGI